MPTFMRNNPQISPKILNRLKGYRNLLPDVQIENRQRDVHLIAPNYLLNYVRFSAFLLSGLIGLGTILVTSPGYAALGGRPGQTELQSVTGTGVQTVCGGLLNLNAMMPLTGNTALLLTRCGEMVQSANQLDGTGNMTLSLGLSEQDLAAALQQLASEEVIAPRTMSTKTFKGQLQNLSARLTALRLGAKGVSVGGLNFNGNSQVAGFGQNGLGDSAFSLNGAGASGDSSEGAFSRLGAFVNGTISTGDKDATSREDGFEFDSQGVTLGVDYRFLDELVLGTAFTYSHFKADFSQSAVNAGGDSESHGYGFSLYGTYYLHNFYLEGIGSVGWNDHDASRKIVYPTQNRSAKSDTDSTQYSFSVGTGYDAQVGSFNFGPYARLTYFNIDIDGFKETGASELNLRVKDQDINSLISALGLRASRSLSWEWGVWSPQIRGEWDHEFENDTEKIAMRYVHDPNKNQLVVKTENTDRNFFRVGASLSNVFAGGTQMFFDWEAILGLRDITNHIFTLGARLEF